MYKLQKLYRSITKRGTSCANNRGWFNKSNKQTLSLTCRGLCCIGPFPSQPLHGLLNTLRNPLTYIMPRGRPRKYSADEDRAEARRRANQAHYLRRTQGVTRPDFIHHAPAPPDAPAATPSGIGLRISPDIPVPYNPLDNNNDNKQPLALLGDDADAADAAGQH